MSVRYKAKLIIKTMHTILSHPGKANMLEHTQKFISRTFQHILFHNISPKKNYSCFKQYRQGVIVNIDK